MDIIIRIFRRINLHNEMNMIKINPPRYDIRRKQTPTFLAQKRLNQPLPPIGLQLAMQPYYLILLPKLEESIK